MNRGASLDGHISPTPGGPLRVNDGEGMADGAIATTTGRVCDATTRGERHRVQGVSGVADSWVMCQKTTADTYEWTTVAAAGGPFVLKAGDTMTGNLTIDRPVDFGSVGIGGPDGGGVDFYQGGAYRGGLYGDADGLALWDEAAGGDAFRSTAGALAIPDLAGTGTRVVEASSTGLLSAVAGAGWTQTATIASDSITLTDHRVRFVTVDTEAAAATDNLSTILGGTAGQSIVLRTAASTRDITVKDSVVNISMAGDFLMDTVEDILTLVYDGVASVWKEQARSNNG
jgi:hypothetical protein